MKTMNKIKRNEIIEKAILVGAILPQIKGTTACEIIDESVQSYKENEGEKLFTAEEADAIMQALQSMPGYTHEKFLIAGDPLFNPTDTSSECFGWHLHVAYIMLSITNPELFENYEEEENNG